MRAERISPRMRNAFDVRQDRARTELREVRFELLSRTFRDDADRPVWKILHLPCKSQPSCLPLCEIPIHDQLHPSGDYRFETFLHDS